MALEFLKENMKKKGIIARLDNYLLTLQKEDNDRAFNVNAPSQIAVCKRARYYARTGEGTKTSYSARTQRIFDNGTYFHERTQKYMLDSGILLLDEVPVVVASISSFPLAGVDTLPTVETPILSTEYNIQGHTDGILDLGDEYAILELKSINDNQYSGLRSGEKPEHTLQGLVYVYCIESHRKFLREKYKTNLMFKLSRGRRALEYAKHYNHLKSGSKYTKDEKIAFQVGLHLRLDDLIYKCEKPITKVVFLYENKNTQDLKEFVVDSTTPENQEKIAEILEGCSFVNDCVETGTVPPREATRKSDSICRFCNYKDECWVL